MFVIMFFRSRKRFRKIETARINQTNTALNHRARRAARRERKQKLPPEQRQYETRPSWQRTGDRR